MPIYEYQCTSCAHRFERLQKMSDDPISLCPECGVEQVKKLVSQSAFILKGSGWYKDHYGLKKSAGDSKTSGEGSSSSSSDSSAATPAPKTDSTPAKKSESKSSVSESSGTKSSGAATSSGA